MNAPGQNFYHKDSEGNITKHTKNYLTTDLHRWMHRFAQIISVLSVKMICEHLWFKYIRFKPASSDPSGTLAPVRKVIRSVPFIIPFY